MSSEAGWGEEDEREHEAAMQAVKDETREERFLKWLTEDELKEYRELGDEKMALLMKKREISRLGRRIYHEAPNDIMELIVIQCSDMNNTTLDRMGRGGMNVLRLVSHRMKRVVESCAIMLTNTREADGPDSLPLDLMNRCRRIELIRCRSHNLRSLEGCPNRLKDLHIDNGQHIQSLEPLRGCTALERFTIYEADQISDLSPLSGSIRLICITLLMSLVTDVSVIASMPHLEAFSLMKAGPHSITSLSPFSQCINLRFLMLFGHTEIKDLTPLQSLSNLSMLDISNTSSEDLTPLTALPKLEHLRLRMFPPTTSLLPLAKCGILRSIVCDSNAMDLALLQEKMPKVQFQITQIDEDEDLEEDDDPQMVE